MSLVIAAPSRGQCGRCRGRGVPSRERPSFCSISLPPASCCPQKQTSHRGPSCYYFSKLIFFFLKSSKRGRERDLHLPFYPLNGHHSQSYTRVKTGAWSSSFLQGGQGPKHLGHSSLAFLEALAGSWFQGKWSSRDLNLHL